MSSQAFLWVNLGLGLFVVLLFVIGRKGIRAPSKLNLRKGGASQFESKEKSPAHFRSQPEDLFEAQMKNLNVMFMYNGHNFDAYEVLGIPAGAKFEVALKAYELAVARGTSDRDILDAAIAAIKK